MLSFLTPLGALAALALLLPLAGALVAERKGARVRAALGLPPPGARLPRGWLAAAGALFVLLGLAAAQPVLARERSAAARADAEAYVVVDSTRSMLAAPPGGAPRLQRAIELALRLRAALSGVPVGIASLTDRVLPHLFPTVDEQAFALVARRALAVEQPPPRDEAVRATDFAALARLGSHNFFAPRSVHRLAVLLTDGESRPFDRSTLVARLRASGVDLVVVGFWAADERIARAGDEAYRPDPESRREVAVLAGATSAGRLLDESEVGTIVAAARDAVGDGPLVAAATGTRLVPLAPYALLAASVPLAFLLAGRGGPDAASAKTRLRGRAIRN